MDFIVDFGGGSFVVFTRAPFVQGAWSLPPRQGQNRWRACRYQKVDYLKGPETKTICRDGYPSTFQVVWDTSTDPVTKLIFNVHQLGSSAKVL